MSFTPDPSSSALQLDDLGWVGVDQTGPEIAELRAKLAASNGIQGLEVLAPDEIERAVQLFARDGFVVVRDVLDEPQVEFLRNGCDRVIHQILSLDKERLGNRGSHRYSFGGASVTGQLLHEPEWQMLVDVARLAPIIEAIFDSPNYCVRGSGGDFCLPGAVRYQPLHSDISDRREHNGRTFGSFKDPRNLLTVRDLPCPYVCCNFLTVDLTSQNGPTRQIPGTQHSRERPPTLGQEPEWMKMSAVCPAPAGSVLLRDVRAWHGGTPNVGDHIRSIPNVEYFAPWFREEFRKSISYADYEKLSDRSQYLLRHCVVDSNEELITGYRVGETPRGLETPPPPGAGDAGRAAGT